MNKKQAEALWSALHEALANFESTLVQIIEARAWEPLGYGSFFEAWADRMAGFRLSSTIGKAAVVYQMLDEQVEDTEIALNVSGVGPEQVKTLKRQKANGVPAENASTRVREHYRKTPSEARTIHVTPRKQDYDKFCDIAKKLGMTNEELGREAVRIVVDRGGID